MPLAAFSATFCDSSLRPQAMKLISSKGSLFANSKIWPRVRGHSSCFSPRLLFPLFFRLNCAVFPDPGDYWLGYPSIRRAAVAVCRKRYLCNTEILIVGQVPRLTLSAATMAFAFWQVLRHIAQNIQGQARFCAYSASRRRRYATHLAAAKHHHGPLPFLTKICAHGHIRLSA